MDKFHACNVDCRISYINVCIFLYADDNCIVSTHHHCFADAIECHLDLLHLKIITDKTIRTQFGAEFDAKCKSLELIMTES